MRLTNEVILALQKGLGYELYKALFLNYGKRGEKAYFYVSQRRVKKYKDFFVVVGRNEYIVEEFFCSCPDFQLKLKGREPCAHIIAVEIAKMLKLYDEIDAYYHDYQKFGQR
ncbi:MAG: SWIM zinc finger family protein [Archaeoglobaceae archaeon]|nr:SWIM zinc finger family protein [Archaeoglobaceae archaeon]MDW8128115.1 SWIM zinc finger family protein [Archaeoglobaceae archaeon]